MICDLHFEFQALRDHIIRDLTSSQTIPAEKHMFRKNLENKLTIAYLFFVRILILSFIAQTMTLKAFSVLFKVQTF